MTAEEAGSQTGTHPGTRVGLARCTPGYGGIAAPWGPGKSYPEIDRLLGEGFIVFQGSREFQVG